MCDFLSCFNIKEDMYSFVFWWRGKCRVITMLNRLLHLSTTRITIYKTPFRHHQFHVQTNRYIIHFLCCHRRLWGLGGGGAWGGPPPLFLKKTEFSPPPPPTPPITPCVALFDICTKSVYMYDIVWQKKSK